MKNPISLTVSLLVLAAAGLSATPHYVDVNSTNAIPPYTNWATAATVIQDAVDAAAAGDEIVVTDGVYNVGNRFYGYQPTRVAITNALTLRSLNGPQFTVINGGGTNRGVALADGASLTGFTLTNGGYPRHGFNRDVGGGVSCDSANAFLTNCVLAGNWANSGGGAFQGTLYNCTLTGNSAGESGGGVDWSTLYNCTLTGNSSTNDGGGAGACTLYNCTLSGNFSSDIGGGAHGSTLYNCTVVDNVASDSGGGVSYSTLANCVVAYNAAWADDNYNDSMLNYCCTEPLPTNGVGNISVPPLFVDYANGNLWLQSNSPCINAGNNAYVTTTNDLDGAPRIVSGTVDIGAYEFQGSGSRISYAWLQQYGWPTDGSADFLDPDHDGMNNWQEWVAGTNPTNALSVLRVLPPTVTSTNVTVAWQSVAGVNYVLERSTNLSSPRFTPLDFGVLGQPGTTTYTDTTAVGCGPFFYRVGVSPP